MIDIDTCAFIVIVVGLFGYLFGYLYGYSEGADFAIKKMNEILDEMNKGKNT